MKRFVNILNNLRSLKCNIKQKKSVTKTAQLNCANIFFIYVYSFRYNIYEVIDEKNYWLVRTVCNS